MGKIRKNEVFLERPGEVMECHVIALLSQSSFKKKNEEAFNVLTETDFQDTLRREKSKIQQSTICTKKESRGKTDRY